LRALITGATGFVGSRLVSTLLKRGDSVRILARSEAKARGLRAAGAEVRIGDLAEPNTLQGIATGMDVVFHLGSAISGDVATFERVDVQGTERMLSEAQGAGVSRFVYVGTLAGYPLAAKGDGAVIDERCPFDETGRLGNYARAKARCEQLVLAANGRGKLETVIVRLGLVCGPGTSIFPPHVCRVIGSGRVILFGKGDVPLPLTLVDNAVDALVLGGTVPGIAGEAFNIVDDEVLTQADYLQLLRRCTGGVPSVVRLPRAAYYAIGMLTELAAAARHKEPETNRYRIRTRLTRVRWDCSKAARLLQWRPRVSLREGLEDAFRKFAADRSAS